MKGWVDRIVSAFHLIVLAMKFEGDILKGTETKVNVFLSSRHYIGNTERKEAEVTINY